MGSWIDGFERGVVEELCDAKARNSRSRHYLDAIVKLSLGIVLVLYLTTQ